MIDRRALIAASAKRLRPKTGKLIACPSCGGRTDERTETCGQCEGHGWVLRSEWERTDVAATAMERAHNRVWNRKTVRYVPPWVLGAVPMRSKPRPVPRSSGRGLNIVSSFDTCSFIRAHSRSR